MQISKVTEGVGGGEGWGAGARAPECSKQDQYSLSKEDLVLLYENMDVGVKLTNETTESAKKPNQYVETVVYNDHESGSDCEEFLPFSEMHDAFNLNQEKLDFLNDTSFDNLLCHKLGGFNMNTSSLSFNYDKSFMFHDQYIKTQMQNFNPYGSSTAFEKLFSTPLIDYICCRRLEDNYTFYMENIISYVQNTIEQLKRISNGEYLSDRVKEKWMQLNSNTEEEDNKKILATSTSIPLHVECKIKGNTTWNDIVYSELNLRSLSKILEKKIIVEIPKVICGSYTLYSKQCADNLIIRCQRKQRKAEKKSHEPRVDVVLQLQRSQTGQVMSNISSIMILKTTPGLPDLHSKQILPISYQDKNDEQSVEKIEDAKEPSVTVIELIRDPQPQVVVTECDANNTIVEEIVEVDDNQDSQNEGSLDGTNDYYPFSERVNSYASFQYSSESSLAVKDTLDKSLFPSNKVEEKTYNLITPDELHMNMRKLNMQNSILNESSEETISQCTSKRRSPVRIRIKSPYENKSFIMEEKKRKRLLEIRERREKKKIALSENCKISKHKYGKGSIMPQASNSVTKLSITNKSFYNSIYGQNVNIDNKQKPRKQLKNSPKVPPSPIETQEDYFESPMLSPDKNSKKYINRSYYLDDAETEMMYMQMKNNDNKDIQNACSASESNVSNEFNASLDILQELICPSETNFIDPPPFNATTKLQDIPEVACSSGKLLTIEECPVPSIISPTIQNSKRNPSGDECRKSIDQLYDLMNKFGKPYTPTDLKQIKSKQITCIDANDPHIQGDSESGTSGKHANASNSDSPGRTNLPTTKAKSIKTSNVPKFTVNSKMQAPKLELEKIKKERTGRTVANTTLKTPLPENPLKAISQLLHDFDNVQKNRQKHSAETKPPKKVEFVPTDTKVSPPLNTSRRKSRIDNLLKDSDPEKKMLPNSLHKDRRARPMTPLELARNPFKQIHVEDRIVDKSQKKIADIIDEAKEARGEAVRGPSKPSRLHNLSQPKKSYVQAHHEEYQHKYGKNILAERLQKLATTPAPVTVVEKMATSPTTLINRNRLKKLAPTAQPLEATMAPMKQRVPSVPQLDLQKPKSTRKRRSASSSPENVKRTASVCQKHFSPIDGPDIAVRPSKMVLVESYVHSHYGGVAHRDSSPASLLCRVPVVPRDEIVSESSPSDEATELGDRLHRMVGSVVSGERPAPLANILKAVDTPAKLRPDRSESDYCVNVLEDFHLSTAVGSVHAESHASFGQPRASAAEIEQLETALYSHISGAFQKRLRIKNLTLTPKSSMQQVFLLQSGDAGTMVVKSVSSIKLKKSNDNLNELKEMPVLSNSHLDWTFAQLPLQVTTVGYGYPDYHYGTSSKVKLTEIPPVVVGENVVHKVTQSSQCLRGFTPRPVRDTAAQADAVTSVTAKLVTVSVGTADTCTGTYSDRSPMLGTEPMEAVNSPCSSGLVTLKKVENVLVNNANKTSDDADRTREKITTNDEIELPPVSLLTLPAAPSPTSESVGYTTSLDMLVGLLTEIQKITCQNQIDAGDHQHRKDLDITNEIITINKVESTHDSISISSLDNLRQLQSTTSIYSYYLSNNASSVGIDPVLELRKNSRFAEYSVDILPAGREHVAVGATPAQEDKEVSANLREERADVCFNVPSQILVQCPLPYLAARTPRASVTKIIELPQIETKQSLPVTRAIAEANKKNLAVSISNFRNNNKQSIPRTELRCCVKNIDLDPMFKIKRDLLVSMYSILVLTVFAALSFPELLMFES